MAAPIAPTRTATRPPLRNAGSITTNEVLLQFTLDGPVLNDRRHTQSQLAGKFGEMVEKGLLIEAWRISRPEHQKQITELHESYIKEILAAVSDPRIIDEIQNRAASDYLFDLFDRPAQFAAFVKTMATSHPEEKILAKWGSDDNQKKLLRDKSIFTCLREIRARIPAEILGPYVRAAMTKEDYNEYNEVLNVMARAYPAQMNMHGLPSFTISLPQEEWGNAIAHPVAPVKEIQKILSRNFGTAGIKAGVKVIEDLMKVTKSGNCVTRPFTSQEAEDVISGCLKHANPSTHAGRLMNIALSNPKLEIVVIKGNDVSDYHCDFGRQKYRGGAGGFSCPGKDEVYIAGGNFVFGRNQNVFAIASEELLHSGFKNLYASHHTHNTYKDPEYYERERKTRKHGTITEKLPVRDPRQVLFNEALRSDLNRMGRNIELFRKDLGLPEDVYAGDAFQAEVLVKILNMKENHQWRSHFSERYKYLEHYIDTVVVADIDAWEQNRKTRRAWGTSKLPAIDAEEYRKTMPLIADKQVQPPSECGITIAEIKGKKAYVVNLAALKAYDNTAALLFTSALQQAPAHINAQITSRKTAKGEIYTLPAAIVDQQEKKDHYSVIRNLSDECGLPVPRGIREMEKKERQTWASKVAASENGKGAPAAAL